MTCCHHGHGKQITRMCFWSWISDTPNGSEYLVVKRVVNRVDGPWYGVAV